MVPFIVFLVVFGIASAKPFVKSPVKCQTDHWIHVLHTWKGCLEDEMHAPTNISAEFVDAFCDSKKALESCMYKKVKGCDDYLLIMLDVAETFDMCKSKEVISQLLDELNMTAILDCGSEYIKSSFSSCLNFSSDEFFSAKLPSYGKQVAYLKTMKNYIQDGRPLALMHLLVVF